MASITFLLTQYGAKIIAGAAIILIRYIEKSNIVQHYKSKLDEIIKNSENGKTN